MRGQAWIIALTLSPLLVGGCATRSGVMRGNKDYPYENTDRPVMPYENANRPIMALDFGADKYAAVGSLHRQDRNMEIHEPRSPSPDF